MDIASLYRVSPLVGEIITVPNCLPGNVSSPLTCYRQQHNKGMASILTQQEGANVPLVYFSQL